MKKVLSILLPLCFLSLLGFALESPNADDKSSKPDTKDLKEETNALKELPKNAESDTLPVMGQHLLERNKKELDSLREAAFDGTEYTLDPTSVELVVEMDPRGYGFRTRSHKMILSADVDLILRGRGMIHYDYRFFNYFSLGLTAGIDWSDISLYSRFRHRQSISLSMAVCRFGRGYWKMEAFTK